MARRPRLGKFFEATPSDGIDGDYNLAWEYTMPDGSQGEIEVTEEGYPSDGLLCYCPEGQPAHLTGFHIECDDSVPGTIHYINVAAFAIGAVRSLPLPQGCRIVYKAPEYDPTSRFYAIHTFLEGSMPDNGPGQPCLAGLELDDSELHPLR